LLLMLLLLLHTILAAKPNKRAPARAGARRQAALFTDAISIKHLQQQQH
jgi:hypothetical protein